MSLAAGWDAAVSRTCCGLRVPGRLLRTVLLPRSWRVLFPTEDQRPAQCRAKPFQAHNNDANGPRVAFVSL